MLTVTYLENGVRNTRTCDFITADNEKGVAYAYTCIPKLNKNITLIYFDGWNNYGMPLWRRNILSPGTIIEKVA